MVQTTNYVKYDLYNIHFYVCQATIILLISLRK